MNNIITFPKSRKSKKFLFEVVEYNMRTGKETVVSVASNQTELDTIWKFLGQRHILSNDIIWHSVRTLGSQLNDRK